MGVLKCLGTPFITYVRSTATCEHSQELTPGLIGIKTDCCVFTASVPFMAV